MKKRQTRRKRVGPATNENQEWAVRTTKQGSKTAPVPALFVEKWSRLDTIPTVNEPEYMWCYRQSCGRRITRRIGGQLWHLLRIPHGTYIFHGASSRDRQNELTNRKPAWFSDEEIASAYAEYKVDRCRVYVTTKTLYLLIMTNDDNADHLLGTSSDHIDKRTGKPWLNARGRGVYQFVTNYGLTEHPGFTRERQALEKELGASNNPYGRQALRSILGERTGYAPEYRPSSSTSSFAVDDDEQKAMRYKKPPTEFRIETSGFYDTASEAFPYLSSDLADLMCRDLFPRLGVDGWWYEPGYLRPSGYRFHNEILLCQPADAIRRVSTPNCQYFLDLAQQWSKLRAQAAFASNELM